MIMGVVADDITGSNDIGGMFAKAGYLVHIYTYDGPGALARGRGSAPPADISILDTNSRLDTAEVAYDKVFAATRELQQAGCRQFFNKTCSVFRGNIGAEFDAMLDALEQDFAVVVLGFPKNGRLTLEGIHYVHGKRLEESEFRNDPIHPMHRSDLVGILQVQSRRPVGLVTRAVLAQGALALRGKVLELRGQFGYVILDVPDQAGLRTIAEAVHDFPVLCGSSALAEELPAVWGSAPPHPAGIELPSQPGVGVLCVAGSLMPQTRAQIEQLRLNGARLLLLDTRCLPEPRTRVAEVERVTEGAVASMTAGRDVVVHSAESAASVEQTRAAGAELGLSPMETARLVSAGLAEVVARVLERTGQNRLIVAGGETSAAVCARLGIVGQQVGPELQPGLPVCLSLSEPRRMLVLKSGSFGNPEFLQQALDYVKRQ